VCVDNVTTSATARVVPRRILDHVGCNKVRVLSIPAIRDRVVQGALKLILEPIFEADFQPGSFGYRLRKTAHEAVDRVAQAIVSRLCPTHLAGSCGSR
jgi:RNA-directed DNA polymerase